VAGRHLHATRQSLDIQRLCILAIDAVADAAQAGQVVEVDGSGGHCGIVARRDGRLKPQCMDDGIVAQLRTLKLNSSQRQKKNAGRAPWPAPRCFNQ